MRKDTALVGLLVLLLSCGGGAPSARFGADAFSDVEMVQDGAGADLDGAIRLDLDTLDLLDLLDRKDLDLDTLDLDLDSAIRLDVDLDSAITLDLDELDLLDELDRKDLLDLDAGVDASLACGGLCSRYQLCDEATGQCKDNELCQTDFCAGTPKGTQRVEAGGRITYVDRYEWPNKKGVVPQGGFATLDDAARECTLAGKRLCTVAELSAACGSGSPYPYGSDYNGKSCNAGLPYQVAASGAFAECHAASFLVFDLVGNLAEWTADGKLFGGTVKDGLDATCQKADTPQGVDASLWGLRCCLSPTDDLDGDGAQASLDCDDRDKSVHPWAEELCDGLDNNCDGEVDSPLPEVQCSDNDACTLGDYCEDGACKPGPGRLECSDGSPCTTDGCEADRGCVFSPAEGPCSDDNFCTENDRCQGGLCAPGPNKCTCTLNDDCNVWEDGDYCNGTLYCNTLKTPAICETKPKSAVTCKPDDDTFCAVNACKPDVGFCYLTPRNEGLACEKTCTVSPVCKEGSCQGLSCAAAGLTCADGSCISNECKAGSRICDGPFSYLTCKPAGNAWSAPALCEAGRYCDNGECRLQVCGPGMPSCLGRLAGTCNQAGSGLLPGYLDCQSLPATPICQAGVCTVCVPACSGRNCGPDSCGGSCGTCACGNVCQPQGTCLFTACDGRQCGDDGCGKKCGVCTGLQELCVDFKCKCQPSCTGKTCGADGCSGSCGACAADSYCDAGVCRKKCGNGQCEAGETACNCKADCGDPCKGKVCGDNGCGGTCGACAADFRCEIGACVPKWTRIASGQHFTCGVKGDGTAWCWGLNEHGQLGDGSKTARLTPVKVNGLTGAAAVATGTYHSCARKGDGTVWCWGHNSYGQLGDGTNLAKITPVQMNGFAATALVAGALHNCALKGDGTAWCWGYNGYGQLGDGTRVTKTAPVRVGVLAGVAAIAAGANHTCAIAGDGTVWCWGYNPHGQLGDGTATLRTGPVKVNGLTGAVAIAAGTNHTCAVRNDGTVWCWGYNGFGQLGDGTTLAKTTPVQVADIAGATAVAANNQTLVIRTDGGAWSWGQNSYGQLGDGTKANRTKPVKVSGLAATTVVSAGIYHSCGLSADGIAWCWGHNAHGQLGDGTKAEKLSPVKVQ